MPSLRCYHSHGFIVGGYGIPAIPTPPSQGVQRSPLHQPSTHAPTLQSSHGIHGTHRSFWWRRASHRFHRCSQIRRVWHPAIPTPPSEVLPRNSQKLLAEKSLPRISQMLTDVRLRRVLPRNSRNSQKLLAEKSLPQMHTDAHRWLGCVWFSHGIHGTHRNFWRRRASHGFHRCTQMVRLRRALSQNSQNSQKFLAEKSLPRISQMPTDG